MDGRGANNTESLVFVLGGTNSSKIGINSDESAHKIRRIESPTYKGFHGNNSSQESKVIKLRRTQLSN